MDCVIIVRPRARRLCLSRSLYDCLMQSQPFLPTCMHYAELLDITKANYGIPLDRLRDKCGEWTYVDWAKFFRLK